MLGNPRSSLESIWDGMAEEGYCTHCSLRYSSLSRFAVQCSCFQLNKVCKIQHPQCSYSKSLYFLLHLQIVVLGKNKGFYFSFVQPFSCLFILYTFIWTSIACYFPWCVWLVNVFENYFLCGNKFLEKWLP